MLLVPAMIPEWCFLQEVLMWVAVHRLPRHDHTDDGHDVREQEQCEFNGSLIDWLWEEETAELRLTKDPRLEDYDRWEEDYGVARQSISGADAMQQWQQARDERLAGEFKKWKGSFDSAVELHQVRIFVELKKARISAV
jgi:hypothetical protein